MTAVTAAGAVSVPPTASGPVAVTLAAGTLDGARPGAVLEFTALSRALKGSLEALLDGRTVTLKANPATAMPAIPDGARLTVQVGAQGQLALTAVNGRVLGGATAVIGQDGAGAAPHPSPAASGSALPSGTAPATTAGLTATVLRPAVTPAPGMPTLAAGTQITVRIVDIAAPGGHGPATGAAAAPPAGTGNAASPSAPSPAVAAPPAAGGPPPTSGVPAAIGTPPASGTPTGQTAPAATSGPAVGTAVTVPSPMPAAPGPPPSAAPPSSPTAPSSPAPVVTLGGTVVAQPPAGQAVVATPIGTLAVPVPTPLAVGSTVQLEVAGPVSSAPLPSPMAASAPEGLTSQGWPALADAIGTLAGSDRQALDTLMRVLPQANPHLAAAMAGFAVANRRGVGRQVMADQALKALEKAGRSDVAARLRKDLDGLEERPARTMAGAEGWQMQTMPFVDQGAIAPITLYVRGGVGDDQTGGRGKGKGGGDHRFILDFRLTNLGRLQLDGLVRQPDKVFDLIIRTQAPLPERMRRDIMAIFTQSSEIVGTKGGVMFQVGNGWVDFQPPQPRPVSIEA